jgi:hypothetical protein
MNLVDGGAFHLGVATGRAKHDWQAAREAALAQFEEDVKKSTIPEEQLYLIEEHKELVFAMIKCFEEQYEHEVYQIIQPEVQFDVELTGSWHNCIFLHWMDHNAVEHWGAPPAEAIMARRVYPAHPYPDTACKCWQPHRLVGKTDAVVAWNNNIWLDEYKTTSISGQQFWDQWMIDLQPTVYMYGIWRTLGVRPSGFLLNALYKPSEAQLANWNNKRKNGPPKSEKDYLSLSREAFLRTKEDLLRAEQQMLQVAREWEDEITSGSRPQREPFAMNPGGQTCMSYNRKCDYWGACLAHDEPGEFEALTPRSVDYVDEKFMQLRVDK